MNNQDKFKETLALIESGQYEFAVDLLNRLLARQQHPEIYRQLGLIKSKQHEFVNAIDLLEKSVQLVRSPLNLSNLANALAYAGRRKEAEAICKESLKLQPIAETWNSLGSLQALDRRYESAIKSFRSALKLVPSYRTARSNLAFAYFLSGFMKDSLTELGKLLDVQLTENLITSDIKNIVALAIKRSKNHRETLAVTTTVVYFLAPPRDWREIAAVVSEGDCDAEHQYESNIRGAIGCFLSSSVDDLIKFLSKASELKKLKLTTTKKLRNYFAYEKFLRMLIQRPLPIHNELITQCSVIGDSHVLSWNGLILNFNGKKSAARAELVIGIKAFDIWSRQPSYLKQKLIQHILNSTSDQVLISVGEIDCRLKSGILSWCKKNNKSFKEEARLQASALTICLSIISRKTKKQLWLCGVPAPSSKNYYSEDGNTNEVVLHELREVIAVWNKTCRTIAQSVGIGFVDIYSATHWQDGYAKPEAHCDGVHLWPDFITKASWYNPAQITDASALLSIVDDLAKAHRVREASEIASELHAIWPGDKTIATKHAALLFLVGKSELAWTESLRQLGLRTNNFDTAAITLAAKYFLKNGFQGQRGQFQTLKELAFQNLLTRDWGAWNELLTKSDNPLDLQYEGQIRSCISHWLGSSWRLSEEAVDRAMDIRVTEGFNQALVTAFTPFEVYIRELVKARDKSIADFKNPTQISRVLAIGDSHVLSWHDLSFEKDNRFFSINSEVVMGAKAFHIADFNDNFYKYRFRKILDTASNYDSAIISFGEIDCRISEGIVAYLRKTGGDFEKIVLKQTNEFVCSVLDFTAERFNLLFMAGVPAPRQDLLRKRYPNFSEAEWTLHAHVVRAWNSALRECCWKNNIGFIDFYTLTAVDGGIATGDWHCDRVHLRSAALAAAPWYVPSRPSATLQNR